MSENGESLFLEVVEEVNPDHLFNAYQQTVESYLELETLIQQPQQLNKYIRTELMGELCYKNIQKLINLEFDVHVDDEFQSDICASLFLLRNNMINVNAQQLREQHHRIANVIPSPVTTPPPPVKNPKGAMGNLQELIKLTRVVPQVKGLEDIAGLVEVKRELMATVILPIHQPQLYTNQKISNSVLLYGPPGTGKTRLTHALAAEASACLFSVTSSDILCQFVGQSEKMLRTLFQVVKEPRDSVTILFMDEIDGLCRRRTTDEADWNRRLKTELMCQLSSFEDCRNIFFICSTNCPWDLDTAFLRRFQQRIYVPLPTRPDRFELLRLFTKNTPLEITAKYWGPLLNKTEGYSGSDLADLVRNALTKPISELIDNTTWKIVGDNSFMPATDCINLEDVVGCKLRDLPVGSVQARRVEVSDLMAAAEVVKPTVSDVEVQKYTKFM